MTAVSLCLVLASGCGSGSGSPSVDDGGGGGGDSGGDSGGDDGGGGSGADDTPLEATFGAIQERVFTPICTACHIGASAPLGLRLDATNSYALLVGIASVQQPDLLRVDPGNPDDSYLIQKLDGSAATGARMPLGGSPLPQAEIDAIRQWITDGAQRDPTDTPPAAPIRITGITPLPDSVSTALPAEIMVMFDRDPDVATVNATTFLVEGSGGDGSFDDGNENEIVATSIEFPPGNPRTAIFAMPAGDDADDVYRVRLSGSGSSGVLDLDANSLDGEFDGSFPSGDGTEGGDFEALFAVTPVEPALASIQEQIFSPICAGCHSGPPSNALPSGLDLSSATASYENLVDVPSVQAPDTPRVAPGDPDGSYLVHKLRGTAAAGGRMPLGQMPLPAGTLAALEQWIAEGAEP